MDCTYTPLFLVLLLSLSYRPLRALYNAAFTHSHTHLSAGGRDYGSVWAISIRSGGSSISLGWIRKTGRGKIWSKFTFETTHLCLMLHTISILGSIEPNNINRGRIPISFRTHTHVYVLFISAHLISIPSAVWTSSSAFANFSPVAGTSF